MKIGTAMKVFIDGFDISTTLMGDSTMPSTPRRVSHPQLVSRRLLTNPFDPNRDAHENIKSNA